MPSSTKPTKPHKVGLKWATAATVLMGLAGTGFFWVASSFVEMIEQDNPDGIKVFLEEDHYHQQLRKLEVLCEKYTEARPGEKAVVGRLILEEASKVDRRLLPVWIQEFITGIETLERESEKKNK